MSKLKKFAGILLALVMCFGLTCTAFAADYSITVTGNEGETYTAYKVLDATVSDAGVSYTISTNSVWYEIVSADSSPFTVTPSAGDETVCVVTLKEGKTADDIATYFASVTLPTDATVAATGKINEGDTSVELDVASSGAGYYYVTTSLGSVVNLTSASPTATINDKNTEPSTDKKVLEDSTESYSTSNTAGIGETVTFQITVNNLGDVEKLTVHDKMDTGLTYVRVSSVTLNGSTVDSSNYRVTTSTTDGCTFEVIFTDSYIAALDSDDAIVVTYTATVNADAVETIGNEAYVSYGDASSSETSKTTTKVYDFDLAKTDGTNPLTGAEFTLSDGTGTISFVAVNGGYRVATTSDTGTTTTIEAGSVNIFGLDAGTYTLTETKAPDGYNKLTYAITVVIDENGNVTFKNATTGATLEADSDDASKLNVVNEAGTSLPSTGGIGTTIFYVVGGVLVVGAVVLLITKKRMSE